MIRALPAIALAWAALFVGCAGWLAPEGCPTWAALTNPKTCSESP